MRILRSVKGQAALSGKWRRRGITIGFVPTMGALHEGHMSLVRTSRSVADRTIVSIFVNPMQFGPREDFASYPRNITRDLGILARSGVDVVFIPPARSIYPSGFATKVEVVGPLTDVLCSPRRPGHFRGVTTVVAKLLNIVKPNVLLMGRKDVQQALIIRRMIRDLNLDVAVKVLPTIRDRDGVAMSSRNRHLTPEERKLAPLLVETLRAGRKSIQEGLRSVEVVRSRMRGMLARGRGLRIQYLDIVDAQTLQPVTRISGNVLLAAAVWLGKTRLIDNLPVRARRR